MSENTYGKFKFPRKLVLAGAAVAFTIGGGALASSALAAPVSQAAAQGPGSSIPAHPVYIVSANAGQRLGAAEQAARKDLRVDFHSHEVYYSWATEKWDISKDSSGDGYYVIKNHADTGMCVQPLNNRTNITNTTVLEPCDNSLNQEWRFTDYRATSGGQSEYMIEPISRVGVALSVPYNQVAGDWGTPDLDHAYAATNQLWSLYRA